MLRKEEDGEIIMTEKAIFLRAHVKRDRANS